MVYCQDLYSQGLGYFVDYSIITENDLSYFVMSASFRDHPSDPRITLDIFCYINNSLNGQGCIFG